MNFRISKKQWRNYYQVNKVILFLLALVVLLALFPREGKFKYEFQRGRPWQHDDLIAPFDFAILKPQSELQSERKKALSEAYLFFRVDNNKVEYAKSEFLARLDREAPKQISTQEKELLIKTAFTLLDTVYKLGIIEMIPDLEKRSSDFKIAVVENNLAKIVPVNSLLSIGKANEFILLHLPAYPGINTRLILPVLQSTLMHNVIFDEDLTLKQREQSLADISITRGMVQKGERIIAKGELVNETKFQQLESLRLEFETKSGSGYNFKMIFVGRLILISMALLVFGLFLYTFRHDIYSENKNIVLLLLLVTIMVSFTTFIMNIKVSYIMAVPICLVPIIVRTFYDTRLALFVHIITIIVLGFLVPNSFEFLFMQLITGIITIISIVRLHHRSQFFFTSLMIMVSYSVIYIGMTLMQEGSIAQVSRVSFLMFGISALLTLFSYPLIYLFESIFGMITDVSLIELSDTNSKLLRELAITTPGTFQHSLIVSNIAEEAARAIGANSLLARTGALYHDIGKMDMPMYYIENQTGGINPHDDLSYEESARIITGHVIRGIEKARLNKIPEAIIDFIRTHHGTRYTQYFYNKFKEENGNEPFDETPFRYRGPIPFSKETSILMMADSIEAASRSLKSPSEQDVSDLVERLIDNQMEGKQFRNSLLTLKDISTIKKIIKKKLMSIYHIRIEYPVVR
ncbi:MAG TPA: HDIG domain-containing protein [Bacteroidales bacterium]|nr:HDIG domain-containing protein [Bacteroidales bacterium]